MYWTARPSIEKSGRGIALRRARESATARNDRRSPRAQPDIKVIAIYRRHIGILRFGCPGVNPGNGYVRCRREPVVSRGIAQLSLCTLECESGDAAGGVLRHVVGVRVRAEQDRRDVDGAR